MVEVGQLSIMGSVNTTEITQGFNTIKINFSNLENQSNQTNASLNRMNNITKGILTKFMLFGTVAVGSMTALASKSPVLAGTFARMEQEIFKISNTLGRQLKPAFDSFVGVLGAVNTFLIDNNALIKSLGEISAEAFGDISKIITGEWTKIQNIIPKSAGAIAGIKLGSRFGLKGMLLGAALGYVAGDLLSPSGDEGMPMVREGEEQFKMGLSESDSAEMFKGAYKFSGGLFQTGTQFVLESQKNFVDTFIQIFNNLFSNISNKERDLSNTDGVPR